MKGILLSAALLVVSNVYSGTTVIYGEDDRVDVYASQNSDFVEYAHSTAAMINRQRVTVNEDKSVFIGGSPLRAQGICRSERFSHQVASGNCSGFLVGEDLLVTAGHCIQSMSDCRKYKWVFNFKVKDSTQSRPDGVTADDVYSCKEIIERKLTRNSQDDYALIRLDRKAKATPLKFRTSGRVSRGDKLVVIGHPSGLPTKIADGASVRRPGSVFFTANLDTYGGNSGSAVINVKTGEVEGILVRGEEDYQRSPAGCLESYRVSNNGGRGEDVTNITNIRALMEP